MKQAVITLLNTPAGRFSWYEEFPRLITERLAAHDIDHIVGYKSYLDHSTIPVGERLILHDEIDAPFLARVRAILEPRMAAYQHVILHTHSYRANESRFAPVVRRHPDARWWSTVHTTPLHSRRWRPWARGLLQALRIRFPERIYGCSETSAAAVRMRYPMHRVGVLVNGRLAAADLARFEPRQAPRTAILLARLVPMKGIWIALEAAERILAQVPDFRLLVIGDGQLLEQCRQWVVDRRLDGAITFAGYQSDVQRWYREADMIWITSIPERVREGLPLVAMEAQGHALPCLYTRSGGLPESQVEGVTGVLVDPADAVTLADRTLELLRDEMRYHTMRRGIVAQRHRWSIDRMADDYVAEYLKVLRPSQATAS